MDVDREASKLWKAYRTVKEMVKDRVGGNEIGTLESKSDSQC